MADPTFVINDLDDEQLLRHFCVEKEAADVSEWCKAKAPRPEGAEERMDEVDDQLYRFETGSFHLLSIASPG